MTRARRRALWSGALALCVTVAAPAPAQSPSERPPESPPEPQAEPSEPEPERPPRSGLEPATFSLPLDPEQGGGTVTGSAGDIEFVENDRVRLSGGVELRYQDLELEADTVEVDLSTSLVTARGDVIVDQGPRRLAGSAVEWNLDTELGTMSDASAFIAPDYYFQGAVVEKVGEDRYTFRDGTFTSCAGDEVPDWSFRVARATVRVDGYARARHASMKVKKAPLLYFPYILWPVKSERTPGLLVPNVGYSQRRGAYLGLAYYQPIGRSFDTTFFLDGYSEGFVGVGNELRYRPSAGTEGEIRAYTIDDQDLGEVRWKLEVDHESTDLPWGLRGAAEIRKSSDFDFFRDFERDFDRASRGLERSAAFVSGSWGPHLLTIQATDQETFVTGGENFVDRRLPEANYNLRSTELGNTPLVLGLESSVGYLTVDRSATYESEYGRLDLRPELSLPLNPAPWLSLNLFAGERFTWWSDSLDDTATGFTGDSLTRSAPYGGAELIGPSIARLFQPEGGFFSKFLHVVEPRVTYLWQDDYDDQARVPSFDSVDGFVSGNQARFSLVNRLKAKPRDEKAGDSRDIVSLTISRRYSLDEDEPLEADPDFGTAQLGPWETSLRVNPTDILLLEGRVTYSGLFDRITSTSLSSDLRVERANVGLRWNTTVRGPDGVTTRDQIRFNTGVEVIPDRLRLSAWLDFDIENDLLQEQRYFVDWTAQCYTVHFEWRDFQVGQLEETDYRLSFSLKNVGSFLDLSGRID